MIDTHTHTLNYYGKFSGTTSESGPLVREPANPSGSYDYAVPVSSSACGTGTYLEPAPALQPATAALFVSTTLSYWRTDRPEVFNPDVQINDTAYRRLDPEFYAWLRSKMNMAKLAVLAGQLTQEAFDDLRDRFNRIHEWAIAHFGEAALTAAGRALDARAYCAPVTEPWERHGKPLTAGRTRECSEATTMVDAIREQAIALGWKHERLYATSGPQSPLRGLASYLKPGDSIGEVTREAIEIKLSSGIRQHFYNPDVEQPWIRRERS